MHSERENPTDDNSRFSTTTNSSPSDNWRNRWREFILSFHHCIQKTKPWRTILYFYSKLYIPLKKGLSNINMPQRKNSSNTLKGWLNMSKNNISDQENTENQVMTDRIKAKYANTFSTTTSQKSPANEWKIWLRDKIFTNVSKNLFILKNQLKFTKKPRKSPKKIQLSKKLLPLNSLKDYHTFLKPNHIYYRAFSRNFVH